MGIYLCITLFSISEPLHDLCKQISAVVPRSEEVSFWADRLAIHAVNGKGEDTGKKYDE